MTGMFWLGLAIGLFVGATLGAFIMASLSLASDADDRAGIIDEWDDGNYRPRTSPEPMMTPPPKPRKV
jgi:hypothetical protein